MDINDPRRRLRVLNQSNPSLRVSAAPQQKIKVTTAKPQTLRVGTSNVGVRPGGQTSAPKSVAKPSTFDTVSAFANTAADKIGGGFGREALRGLDFILPGKNTFGLEATADEWDRRAQASAAAERDQSAARAGSQFGSTVKGAGDIGMLVTGTGAVERGVSKMPLLFRAVQNLSLGNRASRAAAKGLSILPGSLTGSGIDAVQTAGRGEDQNVAKSFGIGTAIDLAIPAIGKPAGNLFRRVFGSNTDRLINKLAKSNSADKVMSRLGGDVSPEIAEYIASETNPEAIRGILDIVANPGGSLTPGVYTAQSPHPSLVPEGQMPPHQPGTPNARVDDMVVQIVNPQTGERYYQTVREADRDLVAELIDGNRTTSEGIAGKQINGEVYHVSAMSPEKAAEAGFKPAGIWDAREFKGGVLGQGDLTEDLRLTPANEQSRELVKDSRFANQVAGAAQEGTEDALTTSMRMLANNPNKGQVRNMLFGDTGILNGLPISNNAKNRLVRELVKEQDPERAAQKIVDAINQTNMDTVTRKADEVAEAADAARAPDTPTEAPSGTTTAPIEANVAPVAADGGQNLGEAVAKNADEATAQAQRVEDAYPGITDPEAKKAVQDVMDSLNSAEYYAKKRTKTVAQDRAAKIQKGNAAYEAAGGGEAGVRAKLAQLRGASEQSGFTPITADAKTQASILNNIEKSNLRDFEKLNLQNAMRKIWGATDAKPTKSDINYIRKYFGEDMAQAVQTAVEEGGERGWRDTLEQIAGTPRALMATGDLSATFRQSAPLGTRFPKEWTNANVRGAKYAVSPETFAQDMTKIRNDDAYETIVDKMKVSLTGANEELEEAFANADFAEKIPLVGRVTEASDRAYSGSLTKLRYDVSKKIIDSYGGTDEFLKFFDGNEKALRDLGEVINTFTGRGGRAGGVAERHMKTLSATLFAPRLWAAHLNKINPEFYYRLDPAARKLALQSMGSFLTTAGTVLGLAAAAGATVVWDPRSADFAKIKIGNTRYDILGGLQQNVRLLAQVISGQKIDSTTGELETIEGGFGQPSRHSILLQTLENKENPLLSFATAILKQKNWQGEPVKIHEEIANRLMPLGVQGVIETAKDTGSIAQSVAMNVPGFFGVGVQTYGKTPTKDQSKPVDTSNMSISERLKAAQDVSKESVDEFKSALSEDDQALLSASQDELDTLVDEGVIDQKDVERIEGYKQAIDNIKGVDTPDGLSSNVAKSFYKKYNSLTKQGQERYLKGKPDATAKEIATEVNKFRADGLEEFKPSNELAKLYADFEEDMNTKEYSDIDSRERKLKFQREAAQLNLDDDAREVYTEGSSSDLRSVIDNEGITQAALDAAVKLDEQLYLAGITGSRKFSNKFRREFGYKEIFRTGSGSDGSGSGSSKTQRQYLSQLVPSASLSNRGGAAPKVRSRSRGLTFKAPDNIRKSGPSGRRVNIKL